MNFYPKSFIGLLGWDGQVIERYILILSVNL